MMSKAGAIIASHPAITPGHASDEVTDAHHIEANRSRRASRDDDGFTELLVGQDVGLHHQRALNHWQ